MEDKYIKGTKIVDHTGKVFGDLKVISFKEKLVKHPIWFVECLCCGKEFTMQSTHLVNKVKGIGCGNGCSVRINKVTHLENNVSIVDVSTPKLPNTFCTVDTDQFHKFMKGNRWWASKAPHSKITYVCAKQNNKRVSLHRVLNNTPDHLVTDHINGDGLDNRLVNLRDATFSENQRNRCLSPLNTTGCSGVRKLPNGKYIASINRGVNELIRLGTFVNLEDAIEARLSKEIEYGYHENNGRIREENI